MKTKLLTALLAITLSSPAFALRTLGDVDCGEWVSRGETPAKKLRTGSWLTGFMTGLNIADEFNRDSLRKASAEQVFLWMDNYCRANPLKTLSTGGQVLMEELSKK